MAEDFEGRVAGIFILVTKSYRVTRGQPRPDGAGYTPGLMWVDATRIARIEPLTPPALTWHREPPIEPVVIVHLDDGSHDFYEESASDMVAMCNIAKRNHEKMRQKFIAHMKKGKPET